MAEPSLQPHQLPPLILHPFTDAWSSIDVLESAKAAAQMLLSGEGPPTQAEQIRERVLAGRYAEFRMLLFVGKDVFRWLSQCVDFTQRTDALNSRGLVEQTFAELLISGTPADVEAKLRRWGVSDYPRIFARAIGIYVQFHEPPERDILAPEYLRHYYRFADYAYTCWKESAKYPVVLSSELIFSLYASGEYSKFLEEQWQR